MKTNWSRAIQATFPLLLAGCCAGCNLIATVGYLSGGAMVDPAYAGLEGKRVAVLCLSDSTSYGAGTESEVLARNVGGLLQQHVKDIDVVSWSEVADWIDKNGWDQVDYRDVGRGVHAQRVVAIDLEGFRLFEGSTLYKGRANLTVTVLEMTDGGKEAFRKQLPEVTFPQNSVYHTTDTSEANFRRKFLRVLAEQAAKQFYPYEVFEDYSRDPAVLSE